jgi:hypothetical protein
LDDGDLLMNLYCYKISIGSYDSFQEDNLFSHKYYDKDDIKKIFHDSLEQVYKQKMETIDHDYSLSVYNLYDDVIEYMIKNYEFWRIEYNARINIDEYASDEINENSDDITQKVMNECRRKYRK